MKGFPRHFNSKEDFLYVKEHFPREMWALRFQALLDDRMKWMQVRKLEKGETGQTDETHCVVQTKDENGKVVQEDQYELRENHLAKLFRIGFTVNEVEDILNETQ